MSIISLITDFGTKDWFAAEMKAVIYSIVPHVNIVDITHHIPPGDIRGAAFVLKASYEKFPGKTVFCVPVDPGAPDSCSPIAIETDRYFFIGPDNGVLSWAADERKIKSVVRLDRKFNLQKDYSHTFRGRDIFAPAAAHLSTCTSVGELGRETESFMRIPFPEVEISAGKIIGEMLYIDRFGNCITNIVPETVSDKKSCELLCKGKRHRVEPVTTYDSRDSNTILFYRGSAGYMELGLHCANASIKLDLKTTEKFELLF